MSADKEKVQVTLKKLVNQSQILVIRKEFVLYEIGKKKERVLVVVVINVNINILIFIVTSYLIFTTKYNRNSKRTYVSHRVRKNSHHHLLSGNGEVLVGANRSSPPFVLTTIL